MKYKKYVVLISLILFLILSITGYRLFISNYEIKNKNQVLGTIIEPERTSYVNTPENVTPLPTNKSSKTVSPTEKTIQTQASIPMIVQRIPVFLPHNNSTVMCEAVGKDAIVSASQNIILVKSNYDKCINEVTSIVNVCIGKCDGNFSHLMDLCYSTYEFGSSEFVSCRTENQNIRLSCYDSCKNESFPTCLAVDNGSLDTLLEKYCY